MRVVILGGGESGFGSAVLAAKEGYDVFLSDFGTIEKRYAEGLRERGIAFEQGKHTPELILNADLVIKSPGIPDTAPIVRQLAEKGVEIISEIEFAGRFTNGKTICITGSNGKTTTTTLIYEILKAADYDVAVGGNIGDSFALTVAENDREWYVLELSSFQLDGMFDFRADIAVLMNITPDHLDRYGYDFGRYADSKLRIVRNQHPEDTFIYWQDDSAITDRIAGLDMPMRLLPFTACKEEGAQTVNGSAGAQQTLAAIAKPGAGTHITAGTCAETHGNSAIAGAPKTFTKEGACLDHDGIIRANVGGKRLELDISKMLIKGLHNSYNVMAAAMAAMAAGVGNEITERTIYSFAGVEHRMEFAAEIGGVEYINDSKATNVDSAWYALESMRRPVVWIAGGTDKGNDYGPLREFAREKVKALVCMGADNEKLKKAFSGLVPHIYDTHSLADAMAACRQAAESGDTVLLSPACASFDLFKNYEDRGRQFKAAIEALKLDD